LWFLLIFCAVARAYNPLPTASQEKQEPYTISARVDMVALDVTVVDRRGGFVSGLGRENFRVYEDGKPQEITLFHQEDVPVTIGIVVDGSGSMRHKRPHVVNAALAFAQASNPDDEIFVLYFNDELVFGLDRHEDFTNDISRLRHALLRLDCEGLTALYDAVAVSLEHLEKGRFEKKALLIVSDGEDNASLDDFPYILELAQQSEATIYSIAVYNPDTNRHNTRILKQLSGVTGGEFFFPETLPDTTRICRQIAKDIRNRYTISYGSTNSARDGSYRTLRVVATSKDGENNYSVRVRQGYFAPRDEER
jgi:VWFA-related protein